jgi:hypothetical protein
MDARGRDHKDLGPLVGLKHIFFFTILLLLGYLSPQRGNAASTSAA